MNKTSKGLCGLLEKVPYLSSVILALIITVILELLNRSSFSGLFGFISSGPLIFFCNYAIVLFTLSIALIFKRRIFVLALVSVLWTCFGITNFLTLLLRGTPFSARDLMIVASFIKVADVYFKIWQMILMGLCLVGLVIAFIAIFRKAPRCKAAGTAKIICGIAAALILAAGSCLYVRSVYDLNYDFLFINDAYATCGFSYCFTDSIFHKGIDRPKDYSGDEVEDIMDTIDPEPDGQLPNVIFVQLESFIDPKEILDVEFEEDPVPNFTALRDSCPSGYLTVPTIGGATVNTEFEVLTGMSIDYFGLGEYPYESVLKDTPCESLPYIFDTLTSHAIHNHSGSFYDRNIVYANLGFSTYTSAEYMQDLTYNQCGWENDAVLTGCIADALTSTEGRDFIFAVTVQAHGRYPEDPDESDEGPDYEGFDYYVNQLSGTDAFIGELIDYLTGYPEPVIAVFYGDHLPSMGLEDTDLVSGTLYQTQYVVWRNKGRVLGDDEDIEAFRLGAHVMDITGLNGGIIPSYHLAHCGEEGYLEGLEMLQYDMLYGDRVAYEGDVPEPSDIRMGIREIKISSAEQSSGKIYVYGENFTPSSVVCTGGHRRKTEYVDSGLLIASAGIRDDEALTVVQLSPDRVELSKTAEYYVN